MVYTLLYIISSKTAHRVVGYFEEEACKSYTEFLDKIASGEVEKHCRASHRNQLLQVATGCTFDGRYFTYPRR